MNTITLKQYHDKIEELIKQSYVTSPPKKKLKTMGKSAGIRYGKQAEVAAIHFLKQHPAVQKIREQVRFRPVGGLSCIDVVLDMRNGEIVYVPVAKDIWRATAQCDRLETLYAKFEGKLIKDYNVCYLMASDYKVRLKQTFKEGTIKEVLVNEELQELADANIVHNIETLWQHLHTFK